MTDKEYQNHRESVKERMAALENKGTKHDAEKPRWLLLPWEQLEEVVKVLTFGAKKYKPYNWQQVENGQERYLNAALRHIAAIGKSEHTDPETGLSHYAHAICSLLFAFWHSATGGIKK